MDKGFRHLQGAIQENGLLYTECEYVIIETRRYICRPKCNVKSLFQFPWKKNDWPIFFYLCSDALSYESAKLETIGSFIVHTHLHNCLKYISEVSVFNVVGSNIRVFIP